MSYLRRIYKIVALFAWLGIVFILSIPHRFTGWRGRKKISQLQMLYMKGAGKIIGLCVKCHGKVPNLPSGLVVSNHLGYVDILAHGAVFPLRFTPKKVIAEWPILSQVVALGHPVWVDRTNRSASRKAMREFVKTMKKGIYLIVYPEGTSSDGKNGILPFKSTSFESASFGKLPIIPILTFYRKNSSKAPIAWYGDMDLMPHLWDVLGMPKIEADLYFLPPIYPEERNRKDLASFTHEVMSREYENIAKKQHEKISV